MKRIFTICAVIFFLSLTFSAYKNVASAQDVTPDPNLPCPTVTPPASYDNKIAPTYTINNLPVNDNPDCLYNLYAYPATRIDGNTRSIWVEFNNLDPSKSYWLCNQQSLLKCVGDRITKFNPKSNGTITLNVCGADENAIKGDQVEKYNDTDKSGSEIDESCDAKRDYFHEGRTYRIAVYSSKKGAQTDTGGLPVVGTEVVVAQFFVAHSYPLVKISSANPFTSPIDISLWGRRPGGDTGNNYQVVVEGIDNHYKQEHCYTVPSNSADINANQTVGINTQSHDDIKEQATFILNGTGNGGVTARDMSQANTHHFAIGGESADLHLGRGTYVTKINERVSDSRPLGFGDNCEGGMTYMHVFFQITGANADSALKILKVVYDPNSSDSNKIDKVVPVPPPPCAKGAFDKDTGTCTAFDVALLGKIQLEPLPFIKSVYTLVLSIGGFGALLIIIRAGYILMTSRGEKEPIEKARAQITSAIIGLLFIVFAYVILSIIGVDILKIPGFG